MKKLTENFLNQETERAIAQFCPYGYLDIKAATRAALEAGKTTEFVYESVEEFCQSCDMSINTVDPVYCVYDALLQEVRTEIEELTKYDISNDFRGGTEIYTADNFMCTQYDYSQEAIEELKEKLKENEITKDQISEVLNWFLNQLDISL